jgi:iron complex outermembrane receptor protein
VNLEYQANDDLLTYFRYANGYKAGGFNVDLVPTVDDLRFEEETVDSFELGLKSVLFDGRLRLNVAVFQAEYDDYQVFQFRFDPFSGTTALLVSNAASVTTKGVEIEGVVQITDSFDLSYGLGYTDAKFDDFPGGAVDPGTGATVNVAGNTLPRAPEITGSLTARYRFSVGSTEGTAVLNYTYTDDQYFNPDNRENSLQEAYSLLNASVDLKLGDHWDVGIWGRNL